VKLGENLHKKTMAFYWEGCHGVSCCCPMQFMDHLKKMSFYGKIEGPGAGKNQLAYQVYHLSISMIIEIYLLLKG